MSLFEATDYRRLLVEKIASRPRNGRGARSKMAAALKCQTTYISHVLAGRGHFNSEQAEAATRFLGFSDEEKDFFLLLSQVNRAASPELRQYYGSKLEQLRAARTLLRNRIQVPPTIGALDRRRYYSSWHFAAAHMLLTLPSCTSVDELAQRLGTGRARAAEVAEELCRMGLVEPETLRVTEARVNLPGDAPEITQHHLNWRLRAMQAIEAQNSGDLHYSGVATLAAEDVSALKEIFIRAIKNAGELVKNSPAERGLSVTVDLFEI